MSIPSVHSFTNTRTRISRKPWTLLWEQTSLMYTSSCYYCCFCHSGLVLASPMHVLKTFLCLCDESFTAGGPWVWNDLSSYLQQQISIVTVFLFAPEKHSHLVRCDSFPCRSLMQDQWSKYDSRAGGTRPIQQSTSQ